MEGYARLSSLFVQYPDLTCLRRFSQLSNELLLYKQAELCCLENKIAALREAEPLECATSWHKWQSDDTNVVAKAKREKFVELDSKLRTYQKDVLRIAQFEAMTRPSRLTCENVSDWLYRKGCGAGFLSPTEAVPWDEDNAKDLVCVSSQLDELDRTFMTILAPAWHKLVGRWAQPVDEEKGLGEVWAYPTKHFILLANIFCVFMSAVVPSASIFGLFFVEKLLCRLVMIACFTLIFATIVLLGFGCRRSDTFAATVAFAAVQVVFVEGVNSIQS